MRRSALIVRSLLAVVVGLSLVVQPALAAGSDQSATDAVAPAATDFVCQGTWFFRSAGVDAAFQEGDTWLGGTFTFVEGGDAGEMRVRLMDDGFIVARFRFGPDPVDPNDEATITFASPIHITGILWHGNGPTPPDVGWSFNGIPAPVTGNTGVITPVDMTTVSIAMIMAGGESGGIDFCFEPAPAGTSCVEWWNPAGMPSAQPGPPGGTSLPPRTTPHENPDGFFKVDVVGDGSFFVLTGGVSFGPFASGSVIKYTQTPGGKPKNKKIGTSGNGTANHVLRHISGPSEFVTYPANEPNNQTICYVPPPPTHP